MENISEKIGKCCLYDETPPLYTEPKYISAFGFLALVNPPPQPKPQPAPTQPKESQNLKTRGRPKGRKGAVCVDKTLDSCY